ncbi:MAG: spondin domain-containing protein [Candidatus Sericytochromatia bacterium]
MKHPLFPISLIMAISLGLSACGDPVLNNQAIDTTQAVPTVTAELTPGSKGQQELSGKLVQRLYSKGLSTVRPASGEVILIHRGSRQETKVPLLADGGFRLPADLADGEYDVTASLLSGSLSYSESFPSLRVANHLPERFLDLASELVELKGQIRLEGQDRSAGAEVSLIGLALSTRTDADGSYDLGEVPAVLLKDRDIRIRKPNFTTIELPVGINTGLEQNLPSRLLKSVVPISPSLVLQHEAGKVAVTVSTAGTFGTATDPLGGSADGPAQAAGFNQPGAMALAADGSLYIADRSNHRIRKLSATGQVSTYAGNQAGYADGPALQARFDTPNGLALDQDGNLFVSDTWNHALRKISPGGQVSTYAGGTAGYADGPLAQARFNQPTDLSSDSQGNLYLLDFGNQAIRKITPAGEVETVFRSDWPLRGVLTELQAGFRKYPDYALPPTALLGPENARLMFPRNLAVAPNGDLYVSDAANFMIYRIRQGQAEHFAGNNRLYFEGSASPRRDQILLDNPQALAVDQHGTVFVTDQYGIYQIPENGIPVRLLALNGRQILFYQQQERFIQENLFIPGSLLLRPDGSLSVSDHYSHSLYRLHPCDRARPAACNQEAFASYGDYDQRYGNLHAGKFQQPPLSQPDLSAYGLSSLERPYRELANTYLRLRIENVSQLRLSPGVLMLATTHSELFFSPGQPDRGLGLESYAEDGDGRLLEHNYHGPAFSAPFETTHVGYAMLLGLQPPEPKLLLPGEHLDILVSGDTVNLHLFYKLHDGNDLFLGFGSSGLALHAADGSLVQGDLSHQLHIWDLGSENNQPLGQGSQQGGSQPYSNAGTDENGVVHEATDSGLPSAAAILKVTLERPSAEYVDTFMNGATAPPSTPPPLTMPVPGARSAQ